MKALTCAAALRRLQAYHDQELQISDQIAVGNHLEWCADCAERFEDLRYLRAALRSAMPGRALSSIDDPGLASAIVSRARAEEATSFSAELRSMFEDMHLVYAGLGAAAAAAVCVILMLGMLRSALNEAPGLQPIPSVPVVIDLASTSGPGTNQNPVALDEGVRMPRAINEPFATMVSDDAVFTLSAVLTREGRLEQLALLDGPVGTAKNAQEKYMEELLGIASRARFEPARVAGAPVAVNMVWLFAHTTAVREGEGKTDIEMPAPAPPAAKRRRAELLPPAARVAA